MKCSIMHHCSQNYCLGVSRIQRIEKLIKYNRFWRKKKSLEYAMNNQDVVHILKVNEFDLEMPQSNTADQPTHCVEET